MYALMPFEFRSDCSVIMLMILLTLYDASPLMLKYLPVVCSQGIGARSYLPSCFS
jgi:hypothetical protein